MQKIALFPIPKMVCFPGTVAPLHVFEPRYRTLIKDAIREDILIGIPHTKKTLRDYKERQNPEEALQSNQANYEPHSIFSAGRAVIEDVTVDGRMIVKVGMQERFLTLRSVQDLPYKLIEAESMPDEKEENSSFMDLERGKLQDFLEEHLKEAVPEAHEVLVSKSWRDKTHQEFNFEFFNWTRLDADFMQSVLETKKPANV